MRHLPPLRQLRPFLVPGRVSNLPTVWSNCLAGWWLGGAGAVTKLSWLLLGATCFYVGAAFLQAAFDAEVDQPPGTARPRTGELAALWRWSFLWLGAGALLFICLGRGTGTIALDLLVCLLFYAAFFHHPGVAAALRGICRFLVYLVAASTGARGVTGWATWCGVALALYVAGVGYLEAGWKRSRAGAYWPCVGLAAPIGLALLLNAGPNREAGILLSLVLGLWILRSLRAVFWTADGTAGTAMSHLLAGIVFVDWLAVADAPKEAGFVFIPLFALVLAAQRLEPAA